MTLKYKVGDRVRIIEGGWGISDSDVESLSGEVFEVISHLPDGYFDGDGYLLSPSLFTRFDYTPGEDGFIGGKALQLVEDLQTSNETAYIVGKEQAVSDDNAKEVRTPVLEENAPQTAPQSTVEGSFASVYSSVSVFRKGSIKEGDSVFYSEGTTKITIDEDGGEFLVFQQDYSGEIQEIRLDFEEVDAVFSAAKKLMLQYNNGI